MPLATKELQSEYQKKHYRWNKERYLQRNIDRRNKYRQIIQEAKENKPCTDCGVCYHPVAMDFHHVFPAEKSFEISDACRIASSEKVLKNEIAKCIILCSIAIAFENLICV